MFRDPALLMKRELFLIPFHGWFSRKFEMIPVDRDKGPAALRRMLREARKRVDDGREIIIFPEGTRRPPGAPPDYKTGVVLLYDALGVPCVPVALNSGAVLAAPEPDRAARARSSWSSSTHPARVCPGHEFLRRLQQAIEEGLQRAHLWKPRPTEPGPRAAC